MFLVTEECVCGSKITLVGWSVRADLQAWRRAHICKQRPVAAPQKSGASSQATIGAQTVSRRRPIVRVVGFTANNIEG